MRTFRYYSTVSLVAFLMLSGMAGQASAPYNSEPKDAVPGQYIVVFKDSVKDLDAAVSDIEITHGLGHLHYYRHVLKGFAATIPDSTLADVERDPRVAFVSEDRIVSAYDPDQSESARRDRTGHSGGGSSVQPAQVIPTGVRRIRATSSASKGAGVTVAVIDTGIDLTHPDLTANIANPGVTCIRRTTSANDDNGHGTHVAGTIAARDNTIGVIGVAPQAKLVPVKVLDRNGSGTWSSVICGIDWVTANAASLGIKVANMSLGGSGTSDNNCGTTNGDALHRAICRSRDAGVTYVVAAGNSSTNASTFVPAAYDDAVITVSALADSDGQPGGLGSSTAYGPDDTFATFSNYGSVVDVGAPGVSILSTWKGGTYNTISGTSMATPHVSGVAALYLAGHPTASWINVRNSLTVTGESAGAGHTDPSGLHPEPVVNAAAY